MNQPFYVAPEQLMKDRADYARKGIARGRALVAVQYDDGIVVVAENTSNTLRKVSEIYDRIGFAGVGKYNEFDQLRRFGVRNADVRGYQYSRDDVEARSLANEYVEILLAEVGVDQATDQLFHIMYDGTLMDERGFSVLGGDAEAIADRLRGLWKTDDDLSAAVKKCVASLSGPDRTLQAGDLEVAVLSRSGARRCFQRFDDAEVAELLA
jgi:proteasome alpha subunit